VPPDGVHDVALSVDQLKVVLSPLAKKSGEASKLVMVAALSKESVDMESGSSAATAVDCNSTATHAKNTAFITRHFLIVDFLYMPAFLHVSHEKVRNSRTSF
jgi:hypothetical protein